MNVKSKFTNSKKTSSKKIINIDKSISNTQNPQTIIIQEPLNKITNKNSTVSYPIANILNTSFKNINDTVKNIAVCIYRINTNKNNYFTNYPYLEYLLFKYPPNEKQRDSKNKCVFPFVKNIKGKTILSQANELTSKLTNQKITPEGFLERNNNIYVFYKISDKKYKNTSIKYLDSNVELWWTLIDEICNHRKIITYDIHKSVYQLFYTNPILIFIRDKNGDQLDIPIVAYSGGYKNALPSIVLSIDTLQDSYYHKIFGSFNYSIRQGGWSEKFEKIELNNKTIADTKGKYTQGGIVRFALFTINNDSLINTGKNIAEFKKHTNEWKNNFDSFTVGTIKQNKKYFSHLPHYQIKSFLQKTPLSMHLLDMKTLKKWNPFSKEYRIE